MVGGEGGKWFYWTWTLNMNQRNRLQSACYFDEPMRLLGESKIHTIHTGIQEIAFISGLAIVA